MRNIFIISLLLGIVYCGPKKTKAGFRIDVSSMQKLVKQSQFEYDVTHVKKIIVKILVREYFL